MSECCRNISGGGRHADPARSTCGRRLDQECPHQEAASPAPVTPERVEEIRRKIQRTRPFLHITLEPAEAFDLLAAYDHKQPTCVIQELLIKIVIEETKMFRGKMTRSRGGWLALKHLEDHYGYEDPYKAEFEEE
jgi:hypothetical protein